MVPLTPGTTPGTRRAAPGCAASTYHRQGAAALGGRAARPGPCVLHSSCRARDTRSCPACVTTILACTHRGEEEVGEGEGENLAEEGIFALSCRGEMGKVRW